MRNREVHTSVAKSAELGYFNTVAEGCFSCLRVEATPKTWYLAHEIADFLADEW